MAQPGIERLRAHLEQHNRRVLLLTIATIVVAAILWLALYFVAWWLLLLAGTATRPFDFQPASGPVLRGFISTAAVLCVVAWIARRLHPFETPQDHRGLGQHLMDVILALPRLTLSIFGTGRAVALLNSEELEAAWTLLRRMHDAEKPVPLHSLPVEIPDDAMRRKIVLALQLSGLIEVRKGTDGPLLAFRDDDARQLAQAHVRLRF